MSSQIWGAQPPPPPPPPPQPPNPNNKRPANDGSNQPVAKRGKNDRECSVCKVYKSLQDCFSKTQRSKGSNAKCKDCIDAQQKGLVNAVQQKNKADKEARRKKQEEDRKLAAEKKEAKRLEQQLMQKKREEERKKAQEDRKKAEEERKRAAKILEEQEKKKVIAANEEKEAAHYKQMKEEYDRHAQKLKNEEKDIEKEMTTPSNLVYVVTSICKRDGTGFSPHLQGIFTTCQKAKECACNVFENISKSYRDGNFVANEDRTAKCDATKFLIPGVECNVRVLFELFGKTIKAPRYSASRDKHVYECSAIGITVIPVGTDDIAGMDLPFLRSLNWTQEEDGMTHGEPVVGGTKVYPVFTHTPGDSIDNIGDITDVNICGVFKNQETAIKCSLEERKDMLSVQKTNSPRVYNGIPFYQMMHDNCCAVNVESVTLDAHESYDKKLEFGSNKGGYTWMKPDITWYDIS